MIIKENTKTQVTCAEDVAGIITSILKLRAEEDQHKEMMYCVGLDSHSILLYVDLIGMLIVGIIRLNLLTPTEILQYLRLFA